MAIRTSEPQPRKRIIITLGDSQPQQLRNVALATPRRSRWPRVLGFLALSLVIIALFAATGGYFWWRHYQTTPGYSLALMLDAAQRDDLTTFEKFTDLDKIVEDLAGQATQKAESQFGVALNATTRKQIETMVPSLLPQLKVSVRDALAQQIKDFSAQSTPKPFIVIALAVPTLVKITTVENSATIAANMNGRPVELTMQKNADLWKVVALKDDTLIDHVVADLVKGLPSIGGIDVNDIRKMLKSQPGGRGTRK